MFGAISVIIMINSCRFHVISLVLRLKQCTLTRIRGWCFETKMVPRRSTGHASARGTDQKSRLNQKRFDHVFQRAPLLSNGCGQTVYTDRSAVESFHYRQQ